MSSFIIPFWVIFHRISLTVVLLSLLLANADSVLLFHHTDEHGRTSRADDSGHVFIWSFVKVPMYSCHSYVLQHPPTCYRIICLARFSKRVREREIVHAVVVVFEKNANKLCHWKNNKCVDSICLAKALMMIIANVTSASSSSVLESVCVLRMDAVIGTRCCEHVLTIADGLRERGYCTIYYLQERFFLW